MKYQNVITPKLLNRLHFDKTFYLQYPLTIYKLNIPYYLIPMLKNIIMHSIKEPQTSGDVGFEVSNVSFKNIPSPYMKGTPA
jgi:hypothetical protein